MGEALAGSRRRIWVAVAVVVLALIGYGVVHALHAGATEKPKPPVTVAVDRGAVTTEVATQGTVQPAQTRSLSFAVDSTVTSVSVRPGSMVTPGQTLAKVDATAAATAVDDAQAALDSAETQLTEARAAAAKATSPTQAVTGCVAAVGYSWPSPTLSTPTATPSPSASASPSPSPTPTRTGSTSPTRTASPRTASASRTATGTQGSGSGTGGRGSTGAGCGSGAASSGSRGGATGAGAGQQGGQSGGSDPILGAEQQVNAATTTLANAQDALAGTTITAPIAGRVLSVAGKVGTQVGAGSTFITLADVYDMQISAAFPEADADRLAVRQPAVISLADRPGKTFKATVVQADPTGTSDGTMVRYGVLLSFVDSPTDLLVGQSAGVRVTTGSAADVLRVPTAAVHDVAGTGGTVLKDGVRTSVGIGLRGDQYTEITSGLSVGDLVVRSW